MQSARSKRRSARSGRRRIHAINLFVTQAAGVERQAAKIETIQGFNVRRWSERGLNYWAASDLGTDELNDFGEKIESAVRGPNG
jgi:anti-sigma factor RsiW